MAFANGCYVLQIAQGIYKQVTPPPIDMSARVQRSLH